VSKVIDININKTRRIPITMVLVDKDALIIDGDDELRVEDAAVD
jgi:hypothetical protein